MSSLTEVSLRDESDRKTILAALDYHGASDTLGAGPARSVADALRKEDEAIADLKRIAEGDPTALDEEYGFNNDELLRLGIGYGMPGPLSDEQARREAAEILSEMEGS